MWRKTERALRIKITEWDGGAGMKFQKGKSRSGQTVTGQGCRVWRAELMAWRNEGSETDMGEGMKGGSQRG